MGKKHTIPSLEDFSNTYRDEVSKVADLETQWKAIKQQIEDLEQSRKDPAVLEAEAIDLIAGRPDRIEPALADLMHKLRVIDKAFSLQRERVAAVKREASQQICERLVGDHRELVKRIAAALSELATALTAQRQFLDAIEREDINIVPPIIPFWPARGLEQSLEDSSQELKSSYKV